MYDVYSLCSLVGNTFGSVIHDIMSILTKRVNNPEAIISIQNVIPGGDLDKMIEVPPLYL